MTFFMCPPFESGGADEHGTCRDAAHAIPRSWDGTVPKITVSLHAIRGQPAARSSGCHLLGSARGHGSGAEERHTTEGVRDERCDARARASAAARAAAG